MTDPRTVVVVVPWSALVSDNRRTMIRRVRGRSVIARSKEYQRGQKVIRELALAAAGHDDPLTPPLEVEVVFFPPDHRRRDLQNLLKQLLDGLVPDVLPDDSWSVVRRGGWSVGRVVDARDARVEVFVMSHVGAVPS